MAYGAIIPMVLAAAGTAVSMAGQAQQRDQQNAAVQAELQRQQQYQKNASLAYQQSLAESTPKAAERQIGEGQQQALGAYQNIEKTPLSIASSAASPTSIITNEDAARQALSNNAQAGIQGYKNFSLQQWLKDMEAKNQLGAVSAQSRASQSILPYELQGASSPLTGIGELLGAFGQVAGKLGSVKRTPSLKSSGKGLFGDAAMQQMF